MSNKELPPIVKDDEELSHIEYGEFIDDSDYHNIPEIDIDDRRRYENISKRVVVDRYLSNGWKIISRSPLVLKRGRLKKKFKGNILIDAE